MQANAGWQSSSQAEESTKIRVYRLKRRDFANLSHLGIVVEHELEAGRESGAVRKARRPTLIFFKEIPKNRQNPCHIFEAFFDL
jgi:hypothetical protein